MSVAFDSNQLVSIPPLPISMQRLARVITSEQANVEKISRIIAFDPIMSASVIRWANAAWIQPSPEVNRAWEAVARLGPENILKLAMGFHLMASMRKIAGPLDFTENMLWEHGVAAALAVEAMRGRLGVAVPAVAFSAAIMHDVGKVLLGRQRGYQYSLDKIRQCMDSKGVDELAAEKDVAGVDHISLGVAIMKNWDLPEDIVEAVTWHHAPEQKETVLVDAVYAADRLARSIGLGSGVCPPDLDIDDQVRTRLGLTDDLVQALQAEVREKFMETARQWRQ